MAWERETTEADPPGTPQPDGARWIATDADFAEIVEELQQVEAFGIDTEFHRERTYFPRLALIQLSWGDERALVDPLTVDLLAAG